MTTAAACIVLVSALAGDFTVTDDAYGSVHLKVLSNTATGERASIVVNHGGGTDELLLLSKATGQLKHVLWSHGRNATEVELNPTWKGRQLLPYANRIGGARYAFNGSEHHLPVNDVSGLNNSLHGLLWNKSLAVVASDAGADAASVTLRYDFDGTDPGYPFLLRAEITYSLRAGGRFDVAVRAENRDAAGGWPLPFYNGWHPYFLVSDVSAARIVLDNRTAWRHVDVGVNDVPPRFSDMVPTTHVSDWGKNTGADAIGGNATAPTYMDDEVKAMAALDSFQTRLVDPATRDVTVLHCDSSFRFLQIFTGAMATWGAAAVVLEPLSAMSDAYNNHDGLHVISAGETYENSFGVSLEALEPEE